ncbi:MAG: hypothetical protein IPJ19_01500 [Planctomycetes bacterium]|nr:hypothetical protein [Planctomycetota bacterium]
MARRTTVSSRTTTTRGPSASSVKGTEAAAPAAPGMGLAETLAILSTLMLLAACLLTDYYMGHSLGSGLFFKP